MGFYDYNKKETKVSGGIGFTGLLTIAFIVLKLLGYIEWSWLWVLSPLWLPIPIIIILCVIADDLSKIMDYVNAKNLKKKD